MRITTMKSLFILFISLFSILLTQSARSEVCLPGSACYQYSCSDEGILHLNTEDGNGKLYLINSSGESTLINTYDESFQETLAVNPLGEIYGIKNVGGKKVLSKLNADNTSTCFFSLDCSAETGIPGSIEAMGFSYNGRLFAIDSDNESLYFVSTYNGSGIFYYDFKTTSGVNAADGYFGIDFEGGDLVITKKNQLVYVRSSDGAIYRIDLYFPSKRALVGYLPSTAGTQYTSLFQSDGTFYALDASTDTAQAFNIDNDVLTLLPSISSSNIGAGDAANCPDAPKNECAQSNILTDGGFEAIDNRIGLINGIALNQLDVANTFDVFRLLPDVTNGSLYSWFTLSGAGMEISATVAHSGQNSVVLNSFDYNNQNGNRVNSSMTQLVGVAGGEYKLNFWHRANSAITSENTVQLYVDRNLIHTAEGSDMINWTEQSIPSINLSAGYHEITFTASGTSNQVGGSLDDIALTCKAFVSNPVCGDGNLDAGEECDDGNLANGDGCDTSCVIEIVPVPVCGDGNLDSGEECDDGNLANGDGCDASCVIEIVPVPVCGDGNLDSGEECDDGNLANGDGCDASCVVEIVPVPVCGDGNLDSGEECDDGNLANGDGCDASCVIEIVPVPVCGDGNLDSGEECDDGNLANGDGCDASCVIEIVPVPVCGDGTVDIGEECDDGNLVNGDGCDDSCTIEIVVAPVCGDGTVDVGEECDDGNLANGDGCDASCVIEIVVAPVCGDGTLDAGEECDDGNNLSEDGCSSVCSIEAVVTVCGNGVLETGEACDDGNAADNDGCDATCNVVASDPVLGIDVIPDSDDQPNSDANQAASTGGGCSLNSAPMSVGSQMIGFLLSIGFLMLWSLRQSVGQKE